MKTNKCEGCEARTSGSWRLCRTCKSKLHHAHKRIESEELLVDTVTPAGGAWWIWTKKGEVLVIGKPTKYDAILALALGEDAEADFAEANAEESRVAQPVQSVEA